MTRSVRAARVRKGRYEAHIARVCVGESLRPNGNWRDDIAALRAAGEGAPLLDFYEQAIPEFEAALAVGDLLAPAKIDEAVTRRSLVGRKLDREVAAALDSCRAGTAEDADEAEGRREVRRA